jgi:hypothetical protein
MVTKISLAHWKVLVLRTLLRIRGWITGVIDKKEALLIAGISGAQGS